jgi:hypothetical protein
MYHQKQRTLDVKGGGYLKHDSKQQSIHCLEGKQQCT